MSIINFLLRHTQDQSHSFLFFFISFSFFHAFGDETGSGSLLWGSSVRYQAADLTLLSMGHLFMLTSDTHRISFPILESGSPADAFLYLPLPAALVSLGSGLPCPPCGHLCAPLATMALTCYTHVDISLFFCPLPSHSLLDKAHQSCLLCPLLPQKPHLHARKLLTYWAPITKSEDAFSL